MNERETSSAAARAEWSDAIPCSLIVETLFGEVAHRLDAAQRLQAARATCQRAHTRTDDGVAEGYFRCQRAKPGTPPCFQNLPISMHRFGNIVEPGPRVRVRGEPHRVDIVRP